MDVESIMTRAVVTVAPNDTLQDAVRKLEDQEIRHLPVVDEGRLVGMISDRDLREHRLPLMAEIDEPDYADSILSGPVSTVMKGGVIAVDAGEGVRAVVDVMVEYKVGAVPVVERHTEELVGIVSYIDVLRAVRGGL